MYSCGNNIIIWSSVLHYRGIFILDVDECESPTNLCNQLCTNTMGSFNCSCLSGYVTGDDRFTCQGIVIKRSHVIPIYVHLIDFLLFHLFLLILDVDECIMAEMLACNTSNGGEICVNLPGTFKCECNNNLGFVLIDGICTGKFKFRLPA